LQFLVLVVIFRKKLNESKTLNSLLRCQEFGKSLEVMVWDNSPIPAEEGEIDSFRKGGSFCFEYVSTPENLALSRIYNSVILKRLKLGIDFLVLFDDDSDFGPDYFREIIEASQANPSIKLFLPIIRNNGSIASPAWLVFFKSIPFFEKKKGLVSSRFLMAINSGMAIRAGYLREKFDGYDENLKFYGTDTYFMERFSRKEKKAFVIRAEIDHELTYSKSNLDNEEFLRRYKDVKKSLRTIYKGSYFCRLFLFFYSLALVIRRRDGRYF